MEDDLFDQVSFTKIASILMVPDNGKSTRYFGARGTSYENILLKNKFRMCKVNRECNEP